MQIECRGLGLKGIEAMELQNAIDERHSVRKYKDIDIPEEHIREIIRAAGMAPSERNSQNWHFIAIKNRSLIEKIVLAISAKNENISVQMDEIDAEKALRHRKLFKNFTLFCANANVLTLVLTSPFIHTYYNEYNRLENGAGLLHELTDLRNPSLQSLGAALQNFSLKAVELGYGTCWLTSGNIASDEVLKLLKDEAGFEKKGFFMAALMSIGVPEDATKGPAKKPLEEIYTFIE